MKKHILMALLPLAATLSASADITVDSLSETFSPTVKVSGSFLLGFQQASRYRDNGLYIDFPKESTGTLCITLSSYDGKYKANLEHAIATPLTGVTRLNFNTQYDSELGRYGANEIAIRASFEEKCGMQQGSLLLAGWQDPRTNDAPVELLIRSDAKVDKAHVPSKEQSAASFPCRKLKAKDNKVTYDKVCVLDGVDPRAFGTIEVERKYFGPFKSEHIRVAQ